MKKIIPLIFSVFFVVAVSSGQAVGGWGTCEFSTVASMNAFDPSSNAYDCKMVFVQATNDHYYWNGTIWVLVTDTDDQTAAEVTYDNTTSLLIATDVQAAIDELTSKGNIYSTNGTLTADRTVNMNGNDLTFNGTGSNKIQIGTFGGNGGGKLQIDVSDGDATVQGIKTVVQQTTGTNYAINGTAQGTGATTNTALYGWASGATNNYGLRIESGYGIFDDRVGIGTVTPDAMLDVEGGSVRFTDYGTGTYDDASPAKVLGVQTDGDVIEINLSTLEDNLGNHVAEENIQMTDYWISNDGDDEGIFVNSSGDVGIGTDTPGGALEVSGGEVIFSDYGSGTYIDSNPSYYLGVDATGDIVEVSSEPNSVLSIESTEITLNGTDQDDYSPTGFPTSRVYRLSPTSDTDITGIDATGVVHGQLVTFLNVSDSVNKHAKFKSNDTNSSAANRIYGQNDADCQIDKGESVTFIYDGVDSIWRIYSWVK